MNTNNRIVNNQYSLGNLTNKYHNFSGKENKRVYAVLLYRADSNTKRNSFMWNNEETCSRVFFSFFLFVKYVYVILS